MRLPGGNVEDSVSVAGVVVEGEVLRAPTSGQAALLPRIVLVDFELHFHAGPTRSVATNISRTHDLDISPQ